MPVFKDHSFRFGASGASDTPVYEIGQSIRFNPGDSPVMTKTYSSAGDRTSWTWSCWFKLGSLNGLVPASNLYYQFFSVDEATNDANRGSFHIINDSGVASATQFQFIGHGTVFLKTNRQFRDPIAWYHLVLVWDSDNAVASERARLYINGERETNFATENYPSSGQEIGINLGAAHRIGASKNISSTNIEYYFDGYMAEIHFLDGYSYGPEYFGTTDSSGIWIPIDYDTATGNYGTNGFKIDGSDSATLGKNVATGNTYASYTSSGLAAHDQMIDTPNNIFCTLSPINKHSNVTLSNGNLHALGSGTSISYPSAATMLIPETGKWYAEMRMINRIQPHEYPTTGIYNNAARRLITNSHSPGTSDVSGAKDIGFGADERRLENGTNTDPWGTGMDDGNVAAIAVDMDAKKIWWGHNQTGSFVWQVSGNPSTGANPANTIEFEIRDMLFGNGHYSSSEVHWNFGQDGTFGGALTAGGNTDANGIGNFYYPVPTSYLALCTQNVFTG